MGFAQPPQRHRARPMTYAEAEAYFAKARDPDMGRPIVVRPEDMHRETWQKDPVDPLTTPARPKATRLEKSGDDFYVSYHDTPVVTIHRDGTYTLDHGGYATRHTANRMMDFAPVSVDVWGIQGYYTPGYDEIRSWPTLAVSWLTEPSQSEREADVRKLFYPEEFKQELTVAIPRESLHVDARGRPILGDLLREIAPESWKELRARLQAWERGPAMGGLPLPSWFTHSTTGFTPLLVRKQWADNTPAAVVGWERGRTGRDIFRWIATHRDPYSWIGKVGWHGNRRSSGYARTLPAAIQAANQALYQGGWSREPVRLREALGLEKTGRGRRGPRGWVDPPGNLDAVRPLLEQPVLRVHWMQPWERRTLYRRPGYWESPGEAAARLLPREPLPGSLDWPGPSQKVRTWFELPGGIAVGLEYHAVSPSSSDATTRIVTHGLHSPTEWLSQGVASGLVIAALAALAL